MVRELTDEASLRQAWPVMAQLRPHLDEAGFLAAVALQRAEGYRLAAAFEGDLCRAVAGFRIQHMLAHGRLLYVDDLVSDEAARGQGHARRLLDWLKAEARAAGCNSLQLDSGTWRHAAHGFYFAHGLHVNAFHFIQELSHRA